MHRSIKVTSEHHPVLIKFHQPFPECNCCYPVQWPIIHVSSHHMSLLNYLCRCRERLYLSVCLNLSRLKCIIIQIVYEACPVLPLNLFILPLHRLQWQRAFKTSSQEVSQTQNTSVSSSLGCFYFWVFLNYSLEEPAH